MIYDCFTFFNELDLLEIRLELLYGKVNYFVIVEANTTHTGKPKQFLYLENIDRYKKYEDKIRYIQVTDMPNGTSAWIPENHQRNCIMKGLFDAKDDDIIIISDIDEIINPNVLDNSISCMHITIQEWCCFYANRTKGKWNGSVLGPFKDLKSSSPQHWRNMRAAFYNVLHDAGWHLSWLGGVDSIIEKVQAFAETQENNEYNKNRQRIENCLATDEDMFNQAEVRIYNDYSDIFLLPKYKKFLKE